LFFQSGRAKDLSALLYKLSTLQLSCFSSGAPKKVVLSPYYGN
jgi:hypothetical protein